MSIDRRTSESIDRRTSEPQVVGVIRNGRTEIRAALSEFGGRRFADLRLFVLGKAGFMIATRKGVTLDPDRLGELAQAVEKLRAAAQEVTTEAARQPEPEDAAQDAAETDDDRVPPP
jgi:hypothetical protein